MKDYFTKSIYEDENNRIWFGTQTNGLNIFDPATKKLKSYLHKEGDQSSIPGNMVGAIAKDKEGKLWIGSSGGISIFDEKEQKFETIPILDGPKLYPKIYNLVNKIHHLKNGDCLVATGQGIIKVFKNKEGNYVGQFLKNDKYLTISTTDLVEMGDGSLITSIPGIGLCFFVPDSGSYRFIASFLEGIDLRSVSIDEQQPHQLWIGSGKGLIQFNTQDQSFRLWDITDGMSNDYVYGALQDSAGNVWLSTNQGLSFLNREKNTFTNYTYRDGLQSNEFNTGAFHKSQKGRFFFGGIKGFNWFEKMPKNEQLTLPTAAITRIEINDKVFLKDESFPEKPEITVNFDQNDFNFQFAALDFTRPEANQFHYILEGWDADWISSENRSVRYSNLSPGNYTLKLVAINSSGIRSAEEKIYLLINPPFWKRTEFMVILLVLFLIAVVLITYKVSQLKASKIFRALEKQIAIDAERNRISADMHDEIGSGITHIALLSELMLIQSKPNVEIRKDIQIISNSARTLLTNIGEIIWALNSQNDSLESLLAYIREQSHNYFDSLSIRLEIEFPDEIPDIKLSNLQRRNLYLVTREALNNAIKHSNASVIKLALESDEHNNFCFSVTDDGNGMIKSERKSGTNGILNMKKRMETIGGTIVWESLERGTSVKFCLLMET